MKTDEIFYRLFSDCPEAFFELIGESVPDAGGYEFTSEEVKEISFRLDGIFQPPVGETDNPFWVVEVQFQKKEDLYSRLFTELFIYLRRRQPERDWRAVVIFPTRSVEPSGESQWYREFFESGRVLRIYLDELPPSSSLGIEAARLVVAPEEESVARAKSLMTRARQEAAAIEARQNWAELLMGIMIYKTPALGRRELEAMLEIAESLKDTKFYQEAHGEGREEGREEKQEEILRRAVPRLLSMGLTEAQISETLGVTIDTVRAVAAKTTEEQG